MKEAVINQGRKTDYLIKTLIAAVTTVATVIIKVRQAVNILLKLL